MIIISGLKIHIEKIDISTLWRKFRKFYRDNLVTLFVRHLIFKSSNFLSVQKLDLENQTNKFSHMIFIWQTNEIFSLSSFLLRITWFLPYRYPYLWEYRPNPSASLRTIYKLFVIHHLLTEKLFQRSPTQWAGRRTLWKYYSQKNILASHNDAIQLKNFWGLKLPPFFLHRVGVGKRRQFQNQEVFHRFFKIGWFLK